MFAWTRKIDSCLQCMILNMHRQMLFYHFLIFSDQVYHITQSLYNLYF